MWLLVDKSPFPKFTISGLGGRFPWPRLALLGLSKCSPDLRSPPRLLFGWSDYMILELDIWALWWTKWHAVFSMDAARRSWLSKLQNLTRGLQGFDDWPYMELGFQEHFRCHGGAAEQGFNWKLSLSFILNFISDFMARKDKTRLEAILSDSQHISNFCKNQRIVLHFTNSAGALCSGCPRYIGSIHLQPCVWSKQVPNHIEE